ncbi:hypothetical protein LF1_59040 [Rubripirellula obstinata]|uniref:Uncharacterized protein n=1 Tax=Rubripirellula obstinata TaxID=406547 RepID=A0A5B1C969_9BACT|nr:hypothetical protein LF1_59040 [Rubripirellula obstinata]
MNQMLLLSASLAALIPLCGPGVASEPKSNQQVWAAVTKLPQATKESQRYHVQITSGVRFGLLSAITEALPADNGNIVVRSSEDDLELVFSSNPILVLRIDDGIATIAPDEQFPYSVTSKASRRPEVEWHS